MKRGQIFVRAKSPSGRWINCDVLDLTDESFRIFVMQRMMAFQMLTSIKPEMLPGDELELESNVEDKHEEKE